MDIFDTEVAGHKGVVYSWASILDDKTREQAEAISRGPITLGHVALMPDAHFGLGACVGTAIMTQGGLYPAAVGVDIGCGVEAIQTDILAADIPMGLRRILRGGIEAAIPSGVGKYRTAPHPGYIHFTEAYGPPPDGFEAQAALQFGTLGSGNHFVELAGAEDSGLVWILVHSGSRGVGNKLAQRYIGLAKGHTRPNEPLENPDLAYLAASDPEFKAYRSVLHWCQAYARAQRQAMAYEVLDILRGNGISAYITKYISCHHNYTEEIDNGVYLSRKGAISAENEQSGVIPGSMGTDTYIVKGLGNELAYNTAPHGAGRVLARGRRKKNGRSTGAFAALSVDEFKQQMEDRGVVWQDRKADDLLDEAPLAYKPIEVVMEDARELVRPVAKLRQILNYKGL